MPASLMIAELFVLVLCASYMLKMVGIELDITATGIDPQFTIDYITSLSQDMLTNYVLFMINLALLTFSIYSLLGIASRKPSSWRNVCRSCITFVIPLWLGVLFTMPDTNAHMFDFNPYITTGVLYNVLVLMLVSYSIKRFYVPVDPVIPRFRVWVRFIFFGKLKDEKRQARPAAAAMGTDANGTSGTPVFHAEPEPPEEPPAEEEPEPAEAGEYVLKIIAPKKFVKVKKDRGDHFEVECNDEIMGFMPGQMVEMTLPEGDYMVVVRQVNGNGKMEVGKKVSLHAETRLWCKEEKGGLALEKGA